MASLRLSLFYKDYKCGQLITKHNDNKRRNPTGILSYSCRLVWTLADKSHSVAVLDTLIAQHLSHSRWWRGTNDSLRSNTGRITSHISNCLYINAVMLTALLLQGPWQRREQTGFITSLVSPLFDHPGTGWACAVGGSRHPAVGVNWVEVSDWDREISIRSSIVSSYFEEIIPRFCPYPCTERQFKGNSLQLAYNKEEKKGVRLSCLKASDNCKDRLTYCVRALTFRGLLHQAAPLQHFPPSL